MVWWYQRDEGNNQGEKRGTRCYLVGRENGAKAPFVCIIVVDIVTSQVMKDLNLETPAADTLHKTIAKFV